MMQPIEIRNENGTRKWVITDPYLYKYYFEETDYHNENWTKRLDWASHYNTKRKAQKTINKILDYKRSTKWTVV